MISIQQWDGRVSNRNRHASPTSPVEFHNLQTTLPLAACVRKGLRPVTFENQTTASTANINSAFRYQRDEAELIVYGNDDGEIHVGRGPSV